MIRRIKIRIRNKAYASKRNSGENRSKPVSHKEIPLALLSRSRDDGIIC